mmetsp:Transcript_13390/g.42317  ORF Transcript_13390/g.42317 Transcript_13390/m.42317 type:complete len:288 (+) Transcript_13390:72-935(+)
MLALVVVSSLLRQSRLPASRSTATFDDAVLHEGSELRRARLDAALREVGVEPAQLDDGRLDGSAALRAYRSFVLPKSEAALAMAEMPRRAATVAAQIAYSVRETLAAHTDWLTNTDRTLATRPAPLPLDVVLDGLRSGENVGNIIRTVETAGARSVVACGTTPAPPHPAVLKAACNAVVDSRAEPSALDVVRSLQTESNAVVWALETTDRSVSLFDLEIPRDRPLALVLGNELVGVHPDVLLAADAIVHIPTFGAKNSLNVASAAAVAIYEARRQWDARARAPAPTT